MIGHYYSSDVCANLDLSSSTLRKWAIDLEAAGYEFDRNHLNQRLYKDADLVVLRRLKETVKDKRMSLADAINVIVSGHKAHEEAQEQAEELAPIEAPQPAVAELIAYIGRQEERMNRLEESNRHLMEQVKEQGRLIDEHMKQRDDKLMGAIREIQEGQKQLATTVEKRDEQPKGFWSKLFNK